MDSFKTDGANIHKETRSKCIFQNFLNLKTGLLWSLTLVYSLNPLWSFFSAVQAALLDISFWFVMAPPWDHFADCWRVIVVKCTEFLLFSIIQTEIVSAAFSYVHLVGCFIHLSFPCT